MTAAQKHREAKRLRPKSTEYVGTFDTFAEFAKVSSVSCGDCPGNLPAYIDDNINWEAVGERLLLQDYTMQTGKHGMHFYLVRSPSKV